MHTSRLTSTFRVRIRRDPAARLVDTTAGSSWGVMPTAMARENSSASRTGFCSATLITKIETVSVPATYTSSIENRPSPIWNSVSSWCVLRPAATAPNSVCAPVATTTPRARPACTTVPINAQPDSSASVVPVGTGPASLSTGSDSPVRTDSSHSRPVASSSRMSAGTTSPSRRSTTSPGTSSVTSTVTGGPARTTSVRWWIWECRASAAFSARNSLTKPSTTDSAMMTPMMTAELLSPTK